MRAEIRRSPGISELQEAYVRAKARMPSIEVPSRLSLLRERASLLRVSCLRQTRRDLARFWIGVRRQLRQNRIGTVLRIDRLALNALREVSVAAGFLVALTTGRTMGDANSERRSSEPTLDSCPVSAHRHRRLTFCVANAEEHNEPERGDVYPIAGEDRRSPRCQSFVCRSPATSRDPLPEELETA